MNHSELTSKDNMILERHCILYHWVKDTLQVINEFTWNGNTYQEWIDAPFETTEELYNWLGY